MRAQGTESTRARHNEHATGADSASRLLRARAARRPGGAAPAGRGKDTHLAPLERAARHGAPAAGNRRGGRGRTVTWPLHDGYMTVTWPLHHGNTTVTWPLHDGYMTVTWPFQDKKEANKESEGARVQGSKGLCQGAW